MVPRVLLFIANMRSMSQISLLMDGNIRFTLMTILKEEDIYLQCRQRDFRYMMLMRQMRFGMILVGHQILPEPSLYAHG